MAHTPKRFVSTLITTVCVGLFPALATAQSVESIDRARRMHDRLAGVPPDDTTLMNMATDIENDQMLDAAATAMAHPGFTDVVLKNFVTPWTTEAQSVFEPLNDYTATVIGMIRDDLPFNTVLTDDIVYDADPNLAPGLPGYNQTNNDHYEALEDAGFSLQAVLRRRTQSGLPGSQLSANDAAGIQTTRAAAKAFFSAGTNRAMFRFTSMNYLCRDLEDLQDISRPADRIRQDVTRSPGGDSEIFLNTCYGCHSGMDALAGAYAYYEWDEDQERLVNTPGVVQEKFLINGNAFPFGYVTTDNGWINYWREGPNAALDWRGASSIGFGAKSLGAELTATRAFSVCQVEKVFEHVCFRPVQSATDRATVESIADWFEDPEQGDFSMQGVFARAAAYCVDDTAPAAPTL